MKRYKRPKTIERDLELLKDLLEIGFWGPIRSGEPDGSFEGDDGSTIQLQIDEREGERDEWGDLW